MHICCMVFSILQTVGTVAQIKRFTLRLHVFAVSHTHWLRIQLKIDTVQGQCWVAVRQCQQLRANMSKIAPLCAYYGKQHRAVRGWRRKVIDAAVPLL